MRKLYVLACMFVWPMNVHAADLVHQECVALKAQIAALNGPAHDALTLSQRDDIENNLTYAVTQPNECRLDDTMALLHASSDLTEPTKTEAERIDAQRAASIKSDIEPILLKAQEQIAKCQAQPTHTCQGTHDESHPR